MRTLIFLLLLIFLFLQYKLWFSSQNVAEMYRLHKEITGQQVENTKLQARNEALEAEVADLKSGHAAIEERARAELGMIKNGETFYQIIEKNHNDDSNEIPIQTQTITPAHDSRK